MRIIISISENTFDFPYRIVRDVHTASSVEPIYFKSFFPSFLRTTTKRSWCPAVLRLGAYLKQSFQGSSIVLHFFLIHLLCAFPGA